MIDLVGKTSLRELIRLIYRADGVLCPVTLAMHLAAAVETRAAARLRGHASWSPEGASRRTGGVPATSVYQHGRGSLVLRYRRLLEVPLPTCRRWRRQGPAQRL